MNRAELLEKLKKIDEVSLLELLEITSEQLVDAFLDIIDDKEEYLHGQVGEEEA